MTIWVRPPLISEREVAHIQFDGQADNSAWEDCVPCSLLMAVHAAMPDKFPATLTEAEKLRDAAGYGPTGGTLVTKFAPAIRARYNLNPVAIGPYAKDDTLIAAMPTGYGAAVSGLLSQFPTGHRLRRFAPSLMTGHAVYIQNLGNGRYWWMDPLGAGSYVGEPIAVSDVRTFFSGSAAALVFPIAVSTSKDIDMNIDNVIAQLVDLPVGSDLHNTEGKKIGDTMVPIIDRASPYGTTINGIAYRVIAGQDGLGGRRLYLVKLSDCIVEPDPTKVDVNTAYERGRVFGQGEGKKAQKAIDIAAVTAA